VLVSVLKAVEASQYAGLEGFRMGFRRGFRRLVSMLELAYGQAHSMAAAVAVPS
jgi:hypothetical protein